MNFKDLGLNTCELCFMTMKRLRKGKVNGEGRLSLGPN